MKEIEKNRNKHSLVTTQDLDNLVAEGEENIIRQQEDVDMIHEQKLSKYDTKRELSNLIKECDVIVEVVDARDPLSYRSKELEKNIYHNKDKRLIVIINKIDLVSKQNAEAWGKFIRRDIPTVLFSAHNTNDSSFKELFDIITSITQSLNKKIHVGFVGYPNTGKSSLIQSFKKKYSNIIKAKNIKGVNEIIINNNLRILDKAGVIFSKNEVGPLMPKTAKSSEDIKSPLEIIKTVLENIPHDDLLELYEISDFETREEFLENLAKNKNYLIKGGYPDLERAARSIIDDLISGKIKYETSLD